MVRRAGIACGNFTGQFTLSWGNNIGATDVMFIAALQGQQTRTLKINGGNIPYDAFSNAYMKCAFWNASATSSNPGTNKCNRAYLNVEPHVYNGKFPDNLSMVITTGISCYPYCQHGTGFHVQKLYVR